jgi:hypothetical protein
MALPPAVLTRDESSPDSIRFSAPAHRVATQMSLAFTNAAVANRDGRGHAFDRDWSGAATTDVRAVTLCFVLLITALWMTTRPYLGIIGDARFYTVQALNALLSGRFASDLYFRYGSQDQFTLFTLAYEPVLAALGIAKAGMTLTIIGECGWVGGLIYLARGLFRDGRLALVAVVTAIVLPGGVVMLNYGEQFLTPRLVVEAITLWALGSMLRGKVIRALLLLSLAATVHPLVALPGFAVLFLYQAAERRVWWIMGGFAAMASLGLAVLGVQPFARLLTKFDAAWFEIVRVRDFHCLLTEWSLFDWLKACNIFAVGALGLSVAEPRERRFLVMAFVVSLGGLAVTLVGGDLLHNVLVVDAQQYRATWPLAVGANLFVGPLLLRLRWTVLSPVTRAGLAWTIGTLVVTQFVVAGYFVTVPQLLIFGLAAAWEQNRRTSVPAGAQACGVVILGLACGATLSVFGLYMRWAAGNPTLFWGTIRALGVTALALGLVASLVTVPIQKRAAMTRPLIALATAVVVIAVLGWDQRTPWAKFVETADAAPESLAALLPEGQPIYWEGDVRVPWFVLRRPSYFSCAQGTGVLFFRGTALSYQHRYDTFLRLRTLDFGQERGCPPPPAAVPASFDRAALASICTTERSLGALVLVRPAANASGQLWVSPVKYQEDVVENGESRTFMTDKFYVYPCAAFRTASVSQSGNVPAPDGSSILKP